MPIHFLRDPTDLLAFLPVQRLHLSFHAEMLQDMRSCSLAVHGDRAFAFKVVGVGDINGDRHPDLVFQNQATGQAVMWFMNGVNFLGGGPLSVTPAPNYLIVGPH